MQGRLRQYFASRGGNFVPRGGNFVPRGETIYTYFGLFMGWICISCVQRMNLPTLMHTHCYNIDIEQWC